MGNLDKFLNYDVQGLKDSMTDIEELESRRSSMSEFDYVKQTNALGKEKKEAPVGEAKVEKYKITKEMSEFSKQFKKVQALSAMLQQGLEIQLGQADQTRQMLHETNAVREQMLQSAPKNPTNEVEGQEVDIKNLYINY